MARVPNRKTTSTGGSTALAGNVGQAYLMLLASRWKLQPLLSVGPHTNVPKVGQNEGTMAWIAFIDADVAVNMLAMAEVVIQALLGVTVWIGTRVYKLTGQSRNKTNTALRWRLSTN